MIRTDGDIHNPRTGQRMRFLRTAADSDGALLRLETVNPPGSPAEPVHVHPRQESRAEVIAGTLRFVINGTERRLGPGDTITIPSGVPHHFVDERGMPSVLRLAVLAGAFADEIRVVSPPWPVQRAAFALLAPIARLRGYKPDDRALKTRRP